MEAIRGSNPHLPGDPADEAAARASDMSSFARRAEHAIFRRLGLVETYRRGVGTALVVVADMDGRTGRGGSSLPPGRRDPHPQTLTRSITAAVRLL
jgi:hypothetical protein